MKDAWCPLVTRAHRPIALLPPLAGSPESAFFGQPGILAPTKNTALKKTVKTLPGHRPDKKDPAP